MTAEERRNPEVLNASRRRRIATGSGTAVQEVNQLLRQFREAQKVMKMMRGQGRRGLPRLFG
jgi:signal recognition particle subunit SRP54